MTSGQHQPTNANAMSNIDQPTAITPKLTPEQQQDWTHYEESLWEACHDNSPTDEAEVALTKLLMIGDPRCREALWEQISMSELYVERCKALLAATVNAEASTND